MQMSPPPSTQNATRAGTPAAVDSARFDYETVQQAVEEVYDLRAKIIRIGLMGTLLYRPDPARDTPPEVRADHLELLGSQTATFGAVTAMLRDGTPFAHVTGDICQWMHACALEQPDALRKLTRLNELSHHILKAATHQSDTQSALLAQHMAEARDGFHPAIITLCEQMWTNFDAARGEELLTTRAAADDLNGRLTRLQRIGTHVRLVSLNASVEASRIGEAGRGLTVIAQEFKVLAEEIQQIAKEAQADVTRMSKN